MQEFIKELHSDKYSGYEEKIDKIVDFIATNKREELENLDKDNIEYGIRLLIDGWSEEVVKTIHDARNIMNQSLDGSNIFEYDNEFYNDDITEDRNYRDTYSAMRMVSQCIEKKLTERYYEMASKLKGSKPVM